MMPQHWSDPELLREWEVGGAGAASSTWDTPWPQKRTIGNSTTGNHGITLSKKSHFQRAPDCDSTPLHTIL